MFVQQWMYSLRITATAEYLLFQDVIMHSAARMSIQQNRSDIYIQSH